jgi:hypothetical protein
VESETSREILQEIDRILTAIGQTDYEALRVAMEKASTLFENLGRLCGEGASMNRDDIVALLNQRSEPEQERILRLLYGLRESLPKLGGVLVKAAQFFPPDEGGRPKSFDDRETMRQACHMVLDRIAKGDSEAQGKRFAAKKFKVSYQTMHRTWEKRREITEQSFEEFIMPFITSLSVDGEALIPELGNLTKSPQESAASPPGFGEVKQELLPSNDKIEDK